MTFAHPAWGAAVLSSLAVLAHAQPTPAPRIDPGIDAQQQQLQQQRQQARQTQLRPQARPQGDDVAPGTPEAIYPPDETPCFTIHHLQWQGLPKAWAWLPERLEEGAMSPVGRCLGAQGVAVLVQHAHALLVAQGYVTSRVLVEPQDLSAGKRGHFCSL